MIWQLFDKNLMHNLIHFKYIIQNKWVSWHWIIWSFNYLDDYLIQIIGFHDNSSLKLFSIIWSILDLAPLASHLLLFDHTTLASVPVHSHQHLLQQVCAHLSSLAYQHCQSSSWPVGDPNFPILTWIWLLPQNITLFSIQPFNAQSQNPYRF